MESNIQPPREEKRSLFKPVVIILLVIFFINLLALNYVSFSGQQSSSSPSSIAPIQTTPTSLASVGCDEICVRSIVKQATSSIVLATPASSLRIHTTKPSPTTNAVAPRELFVSIGAGSSAARDWNDVPGLQFTLNAAQYGSIKAAFFEATLSVPSTEGIAYVRLFNVSDGVVVANSDVSTTNSSATLLTSRPIALEGVKVYKVQMKSSEAKNAVLTESRIKVVQN